MATQARYETQTQKLLRQAGDTYSLLSTTQASSVLVRAAWEAFESVQALAELAAALDTQHCTETT